jgi:hypothetical protein
MTLEEFAERYHQEVLATAATVDGGEFLEDTFMGLIAQTLTEAAETEDPIICSYHSKGMKVSAYCVRDDEETLDLLICSYYNMVPPVRVTKSDIDGIFQQLANLFVKCLTGGLGKRVEVSSPVFDLAQTIVELQSKLKSIRMFLVTDGVAAVETWPGDKVGRFDVTYSIWDMKRLFRLEASGLPQEPVEIDLLEEAGMAVPCLSVSRPRDGYEAYLAIIPGATLAGLYAKYGPRLLERNVRSYLQARGKVNKGILKTIKEEPQWFLAYNNGISATAESVGFVELANGTKGIASLRNFQIVNGGQTTASLHFAEAHLGEDISQVFVQCKLCVVPPADVEQVVPKISRCANTQNKVNEADFYANDRYHVELELLSRSMWASASVGTQRQTRWFYERARGQFADARAREGTRARIAAFDAINPRNQKFTKTDLAKFENTWRQLPHKVSLGAEKNFGEFRAYLSANPGIRVDDTYFRMVIARAILFRRSERIVQSMGFGGYRANVVTYTLAYISFRTAQQIDLNRIWKEQGVPDSLRKAIETVATSVYGSITTPPTGSTANVTEWCKKVACWERVQALDLTLDLDGLKPPRLNADGSIPQRTPETSEDADRIAVIQRVPAPTWKELASWAKQTGNLQAWERSLAFSLGGLAERGFRPSPKQAVHGERILREAQELGFVVAMITQDESGL